MYVCCCCCCCRLVKAELLPWAYWNMMTKGYVPWGEYKRIRERVLEAIAPMRGTKPANAHLRQ
jgi:hypothetical protein